MHTPPVILFQTNGLVLFHQTSPYVQVNGQAYKGLCNTVIIMRQNSVCVWKIYYTRKQRDRPFILSSQVIGGEGCMCVHTGARGFHLNCWDGVYRRIVSSHHPSGIYQMRVITLWFYLLYHQTNLIYLLQPNKKYQVSTSGQTQWNGMFQVVFIAGPQIKMAREVFDFSGTTLICYSNLLIWACDCKKKTWNVTNKMSHNTNLVTAIRHSLTPTLAHVGWARLY